MPLDTYKLETAQKDSTSNYFSRRGHGFASFIPSGSSLSKGPKNLITKEEQPPFSNHDDWIIYNNMVHFHIRPR
jgi:hypothetical protein